MRYNKHVRWILLRLSEYVFEDQILDYLYPGDCVITFAPQEAEG